MWRGIRKVTPMRFNPEWLQIPEYVREECRACQAAVEPGLFETGLIVDANNVMYRLAFAASKDIRTVEDMPTVFVERVRKVATEIGADLVVCGIDSGVSLRRSMLGASKKPGKTPEEEAVVELAREALRLLRGPAPDQYRWLNPRFLDGYEGDDICAAVAVSGLCVHTVLYSTDSDLYQVTDGSGVVQMSPADGRFLKSEVPQRLVPGVKALMGDQSDSVEGLKGVGPKTALALMRGEKERDLTPDEALLVRHNMTLVCLPFPGSRLCLTGADCFFRRPVNEMGDRAGAAEEDSEPLPF